MEVARASPWQRMESTRHVRLLGWTLLLPQCGHQRDAGRATLSLGETHLSTRSECLLLLDRSCSALGATGGLSRVEQKYIEVPKYWRNRDTGETSVEKPEITVRDASADPEPA
ncbi:unnamed protein product [Durusdinium trenchii]|uniref:Uncharacterized protein n=1 Tax=Durusdinium trenchii TaxID=1381693 RepID=A0ABP0LL12_9DINO